MSDVLDRRVLNAMGCLIALGYIVGLVAYFYCRLTAVWEQNLMITVVLGSGFVCGVIGHEIRMISRRRTYYDYNMGYTKYREKVPPFEQKMDQICIVNTITAGVMILIQATPTWGWNKFFGM